MPFTIWFWIFLHIILFSKLSSAQEYDNGSILVNSPLCKKTGVQCADDCLTLLVCGANDSIPIESVLCAATSPKTPYCTNNTCSATISTCPTTTVPIFQCTDIGIYPDPKDCTRFRNCKEVGILANYWQCSSGFNFNSKSGLCDKIASCDTIDCSNYLNQLVAFKSNPRFYSACYRGLSGQVESAVYKCNENLIFSSKTQTCDYECVSPGSFKDVTNCHNYFVCSGTVGNFKWKRLECPQSYFFDGTMCVSELSTCSSLSNPPDPDNGTTTENSSPIDTDPDTTTTTAQTPIDTDPDTTTTTAQTPIDTDPDTTTTTAQTPIDTGPDTTTTTVNQTPIDTDPDTTTSTTTTENPFLEPETTSTTVAPTTKYPKTSIPFR